MPPASPSSFYTSDIRPENPLVLADWDEQILSLPGAGFFHSQAWTRVLQSTYGYEPLFLVQRGQGKPTGLLPLMQVASWLTGRRGIGLPFTDLAEPLCPDAETFRQLYAGALALGRARGWKYLECRGGKNWQPEIPASTRFLRHTLALNRDETALFAGFADPVRRAIRKAAKGGLRLEFSRTPEAMQAFYRLMGLTRRKHGVPPQPWPFFANIQRHVLAPGHGWIVLAHEGEQAVAGAVFFHFNRQVIYKFGASDETRQQLRANNLVFWRAIQHYAQEGCLNLDFGRTSLGNEGLRKFKLSWGTREEPVEYTRFNFRTSSPVTAKDESQGWHNQVFRHLPLPLSRLAGSLLYRHIA